MALYTVASVPYLNAKPLVRHFEEDPDGCPVRVIYEVPSRLPAMLDSGEADAALVSSIDALTVPGRRFAEGLCIASDGPVESVRLFSKVPPSEVRQLALDKSSLTSNALAQIVLAERYGIRPSAEPQPPDLATMLNGHDAAILIGDNGLRQSSDGLYVLDLGEEWKRLTGLPFVWALWIGRERLTPELVRYLALARHFFKDKGQAERMAAIAQEEGWPEDQVRRYLTETIAFDLGERELEALKVFRGFLERLGLAAVSSFPNGVASSPDFAAIH